MPAGTCLESVSTIPMAAGGFALSAGREIRLKLRNKSRGNDPAPIVEPPGLRTVAGSVVGDSKTARLCRQVEEAVAWALAASTSPVLRDLQVLHVEAARGAALLRVRLATADSVGREDDILDALARARSYLRGEVAGAVHRKRAPTLQLVLVPPPPDDPPD